MANNWISASFMGGLSAILLLSILSLTAFGSTSSPNFLNGVLVLPQTAPASQLGGGSQSSINVITASGVAQYGTLTLNLSLNPSYGVYLCGASMSYPGTRGEVLNTNYAADTSTPQSKIGHTSSPLCYANASTGTTDLGVVAAVSSSQYSVYSGSSVRQGSQSVIYNVLSPGVAVIIVACGTDYNSTARNAGQCTASVPAGCTSMQYQNWFGSASAQLFVCSANPGTYTATASGQAGSTDISLAAYVFPPGAIVATTTTTTTTITTSLSTTTTVPAGNRYTLTAYGCGGLTGKISNLSYGQTYALSPNTIYDVSSLCNYLPLSAWNGIGTGSYSGPAITSVGAYPSVIMYSNITEIAIYGNTPVPTNHLSITARSGNSTLLGATQPPSGLYPSGTRVNINATPPNGDFYFISWTGNGVGSYSGTSPSSSVMMYGNITEVANFDFQGTTTTTIYPGPLQNLSFAVNVGGLYAGKLGASYIGSWTDTEAKATFAWQLMSGNSASCASDTNIMGSTSGDLVSNINYFTYAPTVPTYYCYKVSDNYGNTALSPTVYVSGQNSTTTTTVPPLEIYNVKVYTGWNMVPTYAVTQSSLQSCQPNAATLANTTFDYNPSSNQYYLSQAATIMTGGSYNNDVNAYSGWMYSPRNCTLQYAPGNLNIYPPTALDKGWNFFTIMPWMLNQTLGTLFGSCTVQELAQYQPQFGNWSIENSTQFSSLYRQAFASSSVGTTFILKVSNGCQLQRAVSISAPPSLPSG